MPLLPKIGKAPQVGKKQFPDQRGETEYIPEAWIFNLI
jgi:hypothetical protein